MLGFVPMLRQGPWPRKGAKVTGRPFPAGG